MFGVGDTINISYLEQYNTHTTDITADKIRQSFLAVAPDSSIDAGPLKRYESN